MVVEGLGRERSNYERANDGNEMTDTIETVLDRIEQQDADAIEIASHEDALEFWDKIMRDIRQPIQRRMRAAEMRAQYRYPKLGVVATINNSESLADALDRAIMRSGMTKLIEHRQDESPRPSPAPIPPRGGTPHTGPVPDRRFRRS
jgi:hypothetical protein